MRKHIILLLIVCLHLAARGQTIEGIDLSGLPQPTTVKALRYWFDDDNRSVQTVTTLSGSYTLDVSSLMIGLHTLHYQVIDNNDAVAYVRSGLFLKVGRLNTTIEVSSLRYWFDDDANSVKTLSSAGIYTLDVSDLLEGLHTVHYQVMGNDGQVYYVASSLFMKIGGGSGIGNSAASKLLYWFDDETAIQQADIGNGVQLLDASGLIEGLHTLHYQVLCNNGQMTPAMSSLFLRISANTESEVAKQLRYWFDDEQTAKEIAITEGVQLLDASNLIEGLHTVHYQIVSNNGALGAPASSVFLKMDADLASGTAKSLRYWFDDDASTVKVTDVANGTQSLDVSNLLTGLHTLNYQLIDNQGKVSSPVTRLFMKVFDKVIADGENRITKYQYWLNTNSQAMQTVELANVANPYTLIALLPMQKEPIHSDCFQFEIPNGVPTVYAKNIFHIRFYDAQDYFSDGDKPFVDYSVKQEVTDLEWLESGVRATTDKPEANAVKWYCLEAEPGDSVQFRLDRAATIQLFSPSGKEVLNVSGSESVNWSGIHAKESGTYYLALHDVTAQYGNTVSIDYNHIDKYAVLRQDVAVVGNGGCSTITFEGNGFKDLYAVELTDGNGNTIEHVHIGHESDATTSVVFDFTDAPLGVYHAKFRFTEEDKVFYNLVTVEEARDIELATTVTYPSTFLLGTSTTYTIKITNNGNMTAYNVPIYTYIQNSSEQGVYAVKYSGLDLVPFAETVSIDDMSEYDKQIIQSVSNDLSDDWQFVRFKVPDDNNQGDSVIVRSNYFFTNIPPNTTKVLTLTLYSKEDVLVYITVPPDWRELSKEQQYSNPLMARKSLSPKEKFNYCCIREGLECLADIVTSRFDVVAVVTSIVSIFGAQVEGAVLIDAIDCGANAINSILKTTDYLFCDDKSDLKNVLPSGQSWVAAFMGCAKGKFKDIRNVVGAITGNYGHYGKIIKGLALDLIIPSIPIGTIISVYECSEKIRKPSPGCPAIPPKGGLSKQVASLDPNDIYGYLAESGSKAIKEGLNTVYYTIEFENDPEFATATAHDIYLADTLDSKLFDISTFDPTSIKIGDKTVELSGDKNFVTTIDMRPEINAIAQVTGTFDKQKGIAKWHITSLDPMTMEPTNDPMDGVLPINTNGNGIGEVSYNISLKSDLAHGTMIPNRAGIVFDNNETIMTPTWTNIIDRITPESHVTNVVMANDTTAAVSIAATDELSGPWRYDVYVQYGTGSAWVKGAENVPVDTMAYVKVYEGINHGFYVIVTDSAGNVEQKNAEREFTLEVFASQMDTDTQLELADGWNWVSHNQNEPLALDGLKPKATRIVGQTEELYKDAHFGWMGDLEELLPTQMYKLQMAEASNIQLSGRLYNAGFRSIPLYRGWNWIGYPVANVMTPSEALVKLEAEEGDFIIGQDGISTFSDGEWTGTLMEMTPGLGYMYRSVSDKNLFYNATAQVSSRAMTPRRAAENWTVDKRKYPNVMGLVAMLSQNGQMTDANEWLVAAFCGDECRGVAKTVNGVLMMNIYGTGSEPISFFAMNRETEEILQATETEEFRSDVLGTMQQPYELHIGEMTGVSDRDHSMMNGVHAVYDLQGRRISDKLSSINAQLKKGVYIVTDEKKTKTQKVVRR